MRRIAIISASLLAQVLLAASALAVVEFTAGGGSVPQGSQISVPITVTGFSQIGGMQFDLTYNSSLLQYQGPSGFDLPGLSGGNFGNPTPGIIRLSWDNPSPDPETGLYPTGVSVPDDTLLFSVQFQADGGLGSSAIGFNITELFDYTFGPVDSSFVVGNVNVVPEPINIALGVFAGLFVGVATLRWLFNRRSSRSVS